MRTESSAVFVAAALLLSDLLAEGFLLGRHTTRLRPSSLLDYSSPISNNNRKNNDPSFQLNDVNDAFPVNYPVRKMDLESLKMQFQNKLKAEKDQSTREQQQLLAAINAKEAELQNQMAEAVALRNEADQMAKKRADLEEDASSLRTEYETTVSEWETRYRSLEEFRAKEQTAAEALLRQKEEEVHQQVYNSDAGSIEGLKVSSTAERDNELIAGLKAFSEEMARYKHEADQNLMKEKEASRKSQEMLLAMLQAKETELNNHVALTVTASNKASASWQRRIDLEAELSDLRNRYETTVANWGLRHKALEDGHMKEMRATEKIIADKGAEAQQQVRAQSPRFGSNEKQQGNVNGPFVNDPRGQSNPVPSTSDRFREDLYNHRRLDSGETQNMALGAERARDQDFSASLRAQTENEARMKINAAKQEAQDSRHALQRRIQEKDHEYKAIIQKLRESSDHKQQVMSDSLMKMSKELQQQEQESSRQLNAVKESAQAKEKELLNVIGAKEREIQSHLSYIAAAKRESEEHRLKWAGLEKELLALKNKYESMVQEHDKRYKAMETMLEKQQKNSEELLARKEAEVRAMVNAARKEADESKAALQQGLSEKDALYGNRMGELERSWKVKENDLLSKIQDAVDDSNRNKLETEKKLMAVEQASLKKQNELREKIAEKERELREQVDLTKVQGTRAQEFWQRQTELENELAALEKKLGQVESEWESRYKAIQEARAEEKRAAQAKLVRQEDEAQKKIGAAVLDANEQKAALEKALREKGDQKTQYCKSISDLEALIEKKEMEMRDVLKKHNLKLQQIKKESNETATSEQAVSLKKQKQLLSMIEEKKKEIREREALLTLEKARTKEIWDSRLELESQLTDLKTLHAEAILEWGTKCESLQETLQQTQRAAMEALAQREAEACEQIDAALKEAESCRRELEEGLEAKDAQHATEIETLRKLSREKQKELSDRITSVTEEFNEYQFGAKKLLASREEEVAFQGQKQIDAAVEDGRHQSERVRNDLTKQLVKKEVEVLRQKAELKQKDAEIAALRAGKDIQDAGRSDDMVVNLDLGNVKNKISNILRKEYNEKHVGAENVSSSISNNNLREVEHGGLVP